MSDDEDGSAAEPSRGRRRRRALLLALLLGVVAAVAVLAARGAHHSAETGAAAFPTLTPVAARPLPSAGDPVPTAEVTPPTSVPPAVALPGPPSAPRLAEVVSQVLADEGRHLPADGGPSASPPAVSPTSGPTTTPAPTPSQTTSAPTPSPTVTPPAPPCPGTTCPPCPCAPGDVTVAAAPGSGTPYAEVRIVAEVRSALAGLVIFLDGNAVLGAAPVVDHTAQLTTNGLGPGDHPLLALFVSRDRTLTCASAVTQVTYGARGSDGDEQSVRVSIPVGTIMLTTPYTPDHPLDLGTAQLDQATSTFGARARFEDVLVTDTRSGNLGFGVTVTAQPFVGPAGHTFDGQHAGLTEVLAVQVPGNALRSSDVRTADVAPGAPGLGRTATIATYPAGRGLGSARLHAVLGLTGLPSSLPSGRYTGTLVFTVL